MTETTAKQLQGFLGLCGRAGQVTLGQDACVQAVRRETAALVLMDENSAPTTRKRFTDSCTTHRVPLYGVPPGMIERALGKDGRMTVAVKQGSMAQKLFTLLGDERPLAGTESGQT
ncbi:MAG: ribosomal L7Ae/L30e/S12e/Gadd45 family protein [Eubacteriales bacterium]|nr:ribosomal L7Ae/L30e/S12e/Gadd45 family protein [Eubacteriales bacterium]